jgi:Tfp pilus assembly protein PilF
LEFRLTSDERRQLTKRDTQNLTAYQLLMQGFYLMNQFTPQAIEKAIPYLEKAIEVDPQYALAHSYLAGCHILFTTLNVAPPRAVADKVRALTAKTRLTKHCLPRITPKASSIFFMIGIWRKPKKLSGAPSS